MYRALREVYRTLLNHHAGLQDAIQCLDLCRGRYQLPCLNLIDRVCRKPALHIEFRLCQLVLAAVILDRAEALRIQLLGLQRSALISSLFCLAHGRSRRRRLGTSANRALCSACSRAAEHNTLPVLVWVRHRTHTMTYHPGPSLLLRLRQALHGSGGLLIRQSLLLTHAAITVADLTAL